MNLWSDFLTNKGREVHKWKHYFPVYERHFARFASQSIVFLEIGCGGGGSLQLWKRFLGPHAKIVGIDIDPACRAHEEDQVAVRIGNQTDHGFLKSLVDEFGNPDVVLDDGSHMVADVASSFSFLYPRVQKNGVYMVEDVHTSYWDEFGGGLRRPGSFMEISKNLLDELNAHWTRGAVKPSIFTDTTMSMHFYDSMVVFERGHLLARGAYKIGTPTG